MGKKKGEAKDSRFEAGNVTDVLDEQLKLSMPSLGEKRRESLATDLALALVRSGWILTHHM